MTARHPLADVGEAARQAAAGRRLGVLVDLAEALERLAAWQAGQPWCPRCGVTGDDAHADDCEIAQLAAMRTPLAEVLEGSAAAAPGGAS